MLGCNPYFAIYFSHFYCFPKLEMNKIINGIGLLANDAETIQYETDIERSCRS